MESDEEAGAQPHCSACGVVMRDAPGAFICPACGTSEAIPAIEHPGNGDGLLEFR